MAAAEQQVSAVRLGNSKATQELLKHQDLPGSNTALIKSHLRANTEPSERELSRGSEELRRLARLLPKLEVSAEVVLQFHTSREGRDILVDLCPQPMRESVIWGAH